MDVTKSEDRFTQYVAMIEDEVLGDLYDEIYKRGQKKLLENMKRPYMKSILKILVVKTIINIHEKNGLEKRFINELFGEEVYKT